MQGSEFIEINLEIKKQVFHEPWEREAAKGH